jgi:hypothetical protein
VREYPPASSTRRGGESANATTQPQNPGITSIVSQVVPTVRPLWSFHDCRQTGTRERTSSHLSNHCRATLDMWQPRLPRRALWGSGASRYPNIGRCGDWAPACPAVRVGRGFVRVACAVAADSLQRRPHWAAVLLQRSQRGNAGGGTRSEGHRLMALRNGTSVAPRPGGFASSWSARGRRHTGNGHGRPISPATSEHAPTTGDGQENNHGRLAGAKHAQFGRRRRGRKKTLHGMKCGWFDILLVR